MLRTCGALLHVVYSATEYYEQVNSQGASIEITTSHEETWRRLRQKRIQVAQNRQT